MLIWKFWAMNFISNKSLISNTIRNKKSYEKKHNLNRILKNELRIYETIKP